MKKTKGTNKIVKLFKQELTPFNTRNSSAAASAKQVNNVNWFSVAAAPSTGGAACLGTKQANSKKKKKKNTLWVAEELMLIQTVGDKEGQSSRHSAVFMDVFLLEPTVELF